MKPWGQETNKVLPSVHVNFIKLWARVEVFAPIRFFQISFLYLVRFADRAAECLQGHSLPLFAVRGYD